MRDWIRRHRAAIALALLSPLIAEVLTGSTSISKLFYDPIGLLVGLTFDVLLYGSGVLLVREAVVRWDKGWASVLLLGGAYGIAEEGFAVHTFFQPSGSPVGLLGSFGRVAGVNTVWAVGLTAFHAVYSIALPILLVELIYPESRGVPFLSPRARWRVGIVFVATVAFFAALVPSWPSAPVFLLFLGIVALLIFAARRIPKGLLTPRPGHPTAGRWAFAFAGAGFFLNWVAVGLNGPYLFHSPALTIAVFVAVCAGILAFVLRYCGSLGNSRSKYWFAAGMIGVLFGWDVVLEFILVPGILLVSFGFGVFLYWLHKRVEGSSRDVAIPGGARGLVAPP